MTLAGLAFVPSMIFMFHFYLSNATGFLEERAKKAVKFGKCLIILMFIFKEKEGGYVNVSKQKKINSASYC